jgi:hypothetical protein
VPLPEDLPVYKLSPHTYSTDEPALIQKTINSDQLSEALRFDTGHPQGFDGTGLCEQS